MKKNTLYHRIKQFSRLILLLLLAIPSYCKAQQTGNDDLANRFIKNSIQNLQEKIFVHTDKSFYLCGEIIWFKLYITDACLNKPLDISKVAYVELHNREGNPVLQAKIELQNGIGNGSFILPFSFQSDVYSLHAYTNWMKNFDDSYFFESNLTIINPLRKLPVPVIDTPAYDIRFFPEGGNLVAGLANKVAFHATNQNGKGISCKGIIVDQNNDSVTSFQSRRFGMGYFEFIPTEGNSYKAIVQNETGNRPLIRNIPTVYKKGYLMKLVPSGTEDLKIEVHSTENPYETIYLLAHTRQVIKVGRLEKLKDGKAEFLIKKNQLGEGISHFTIFNDQRVPVCERLYFIKPTQKLEVIVNSDQTNYSLRQKVTININLADTALYSNTSLSLSVFQVDSLQAGPTDDIHSYLWLSSDLKGKIETPSYYFTSEDNDLEESTDNLMLTHGWSRFKWENMLRENKPSFTFLPEYEGLLIQGKVVSKATNAPLNNILTYLSVPGQKFAFQPSRSDRNGNISFSLGKFYGANEIIALAEEKAIESTAINIVSPFYKFSSARYPLLPDLERWRDQLTSRSVATQVENTFTQEKKQLFFSPFLPDTSSFFGTPDRTYWLDDYTRFITLEEVLREYVAEVRVYKQNDKFVYRVKNQAYQTFFINDPLILFNGTPVTDITKFMSFDPLKIERLDIITQKFLSGTSDFDGIVSFMTYDGRMDGFEIDPKAVTLEYQGLQLQREFYSPSYETKEQIENRTPDFRNVLFWSPDIHSENKNTPISFYTSDKPGKYNVVVQGLSVNGMSGSKIMSFSVTK